MRKTLITLVIAAIQSGCAGPAATGPKATANLQPTTGNKAAGTATFAQQGTRVVMTADVSGLNPGQEHGFHVHEKGDCSSGDGMSTGAHYNPLGKMHAQHTTPDRHAGDLPALKADASGRATVTVELDVITVTDGPTSIVGRGLIVHAMPDDFKTQPTGNSGARIACAIIQKS